MPRIKAFDEGKDIFKHIKLPPKEVEEAEFEEMIEPEIVINQDEIFKKKEKSIKLEIVPVVEPTGTTGTPLLDPPPPIKKKRKPNKK